eukprot:PhM_4_TR2998/c1_g1_i1/m.14308
MDSRSFRSASSRFPTTDFSRSISFSASWSWIWSIDTDDWAEKDLFLLSDSKAVPTGDASIGGVGGGFVVMVWRAWVGLATGEPSLTPSQSLSLGEAIGGGRTYSTGSGGGALGGRFRNDTAFDRIPGDADDTRLLANDGILCGSATISNTGVCSCDAGSDVCIPSLAVEAGLRLMPITRMFSCSLVINMPEFMFSSCISIIHRSRDSIVVRIHRVACRRPSVSFSSAASHSRSRLSTTSKGTEPLGGSTTMVFAITQTSRVYLTGVWLSSETILGLGASMTGSSRPSVSVATVSLLGGSVMVHSFDVFGSGGGNTAVSSGASVRAASSLGSGLFASSMISISWVTS